MINISDIAREILAALGLDDSPGQRHHNTPLIAAILSKHSEEHEALLSSVVAAYYRAEIGRLMQQAEHWAANGYPLAVHHRLHKADAYFQVAALFEKHAAWKQNTFTHMVENMDRATIRPHGKYPPSADLHRYRIPAFVAALPPMPT